MNDCWDLVRYLMWRRLLRDLLVDDSRGVAGWRGSYYVLWMKLFPRTVASLLIIASVLLQTARAHDHFLLLDGPRGLRRHSRDYLLLLLLLLGRDHRRRSDDCGVVCLSFLSHLRVDDRLLLQERVRCGQELNWWCCLLHHRRCPVNVHNGLLRLLLHELLSSASDRSENDCVIVGHQLNRVRIDGFLSLNDCLLGGRCSCFVDCCGSVWMLHHLMENFLVGLSGVGNVMSC